jgi:hypothetical protein
MDVVRGFMTTLRSTKGVPWATIGIDHDEIVVRRPFGREWVFRRVDTTVQWHRAALLRFGACVSIANRSLGEWFFSPIRGSVLLAALDRNGWPVDDTPPSHPSAEAGVPRGRWRSAGRAPRPVAVPRAEDVAACREVIITCALGWHSRWPGLRLQVSVQPEPNGFLRGVRKQKLRFGRRGRLHFDVFPGEIIEFQLDTLVGGVIDLWGGSAVTVPPDAAGRVVEVSVRKAGYVIAYGPFSVTLDVHD